MVPNGLKGVMLDATIALGTPKVMILKTAHVSNEDTQIYIDDVSVDEAAGAGYTAGGIDLVNVATAVDNAGDKATLDVNDIDLSGMTLDDPSFACFYVDTTVPGTSPILCVKVINAADTLVIPANGILGVNKV